MTTTTSPQVGAGSVTSADGTRIGYLKAGHGPAVIVLHGSMETARSHLQLASALAGSSTVLPARPPRPWHVRGLPRGLRHPDGTG